MAKRRCEDSLLQDSPFKRGCGRSLYGVDVPLDGVSPPSLLALLGSRCRKRPHFFDDPETQKQPGEEETAPHRRTPQCESRRKHAANVSTPHTSGSFQDRRSSTGAAATNPKKRSREESTGSDTVGLKTADTEVGDTNTEDCTYNSFQYWRVPLPELDMSLLEDSSDDFQSKDKSKVKDSALDPMET